MIVRLMALAFLAGVFVGPGFSQPLPLPPFRPPGYKIDLISDQVRGARFIALAPNGDVVIALLSRGQVVAVTPGNPVSTPPRGVLNGLEGPNAVVFPRQRLVCRHRGHRAPDERLPKGKVETLVDDLPGGTGHLNRSLALDGQGRIFVSSGSSSNIGRETDPRKATILSYNADGTGGKIYASGLRNASGLSFDDQGRLWAAVNQRDNLVPDHTDLPPDEFDLIQEGGNYGWPFAYPVGDKRVANPEFPGASVAGFLPTTVNIQAHSAPLQVAFDAESQTFFIAYHGSWNRSPATGYKVVTVKLVEGKAQPPQDFVTGWLTPQGQVLGRPVGVATAPGGLFISDDHGYIFKVSKSGP